MPATQSRRSYIFIRGVVLFIIVCWLWFPLSSIVSGTEAYLVKPVDDFFFYVRVAQHIVQSGYISFDGITQTNGFQPLWLAVVSSVMFITQNAGPVLFAIIYILCGISAYITFELFLQLGKNLKLPDRLSTITAIALFPHMTGMMFSLMEGALVIPLTLVLINYILSLHAREIIPVKKFLVVGFLSSLIVLSRLETAILIGLLLTGLLITRKEIIVYKWKALILFCVGGAFLVVFLSWNLLSFGNIFPVSMLAKSLKTDALFSTSIFSSIIPSHILTDILFCIVSPIALILSLIYRKHFFNGAGGNIAAQKGGWHIATACLLFPVIFYLLLSFKSDWIVFSWYFYPIPLALFLSVYVFYTVVPLFRTVLEPRTIRFVFIITFCYAVINPVYQNGKELIALERSSPWGRCEMAKSLRAFVAKHDGLYAMGNDAASTSYIANASFLQLEGLASDLRMVEHIKDRDDLNDVLKQYGVDYLVIASEEELPCTNGCYSDSEPHVNQRGKLTASAMKGTFCVEPVFHVFTPADGHHLYVFPTSQKAVAQTALKKQMGLTKQ